MPPCGVDQFDCLHRGDFKAADIAFAAVADIFFKRLRDAPDLMAVVEKTCDICARDDTVGIGSKECFRGNGKAFALQGSHYFFIARITAAAELVCFLDKERVLRINVETDDMDFFSTAGSGGQLIFRGKLDAGD